MEHNKDYDLAEAAFKSYFTSIKKDQSWETEWADLLADSPEHLSSDQIRLYALRELEEEERTRIEAHTIYCRECRTRLKKEVASLQSGVTAIGIVRKSRKFLPLPTGLAVRINVEKWSVEKTTRAINDLLHFQTARGPLMEPALAPPWRSAPPDAQIPQEICDAEEDAWTTGVLNDGQTWVLADLTADNQELIYASRKDWLVGDLILLRRRRTSQKMMEIETRRVVLADLGSHASRFIRQAWDAAEGGERYDFQEWAAQSLSGDLDTLDEETQKALKDIAMSPLDQE